MNVEELREYCLLKEFVSESFPFDDKTLVFKVAGKMFALMSIEEHPVRINLKCEPEKAIQLRETYSSVLPGYHMNKQHWNTVIVDETIKREEIQRWIDDSYDLIVKSLPKSKREQFNKK